MRFHRTHARLRDDVGHLVERTLTRLRHFRLETVVEQNLEDATVGIEQQGSLYDVLHARADLFASISELKSMLVSAPIEMVGRCTHLVHEGRQEADGLRV